MIRLVLSFIFVVLAFPAFALSSDWVKDDSVRARLITARDAVGDAKQITAGLELSLDEGWHTYWRSPGQAGFPPQLDTTRSLSEEANIQSILLQYPAPTRYTAYGLETIGYRDHVVFPLIIDVRHAKKETKLDLSVDILACTSICVPKHFDLKLTVPEGEAKASLEYDLIQQAIDRIPTDGPKAGLLLRSIKAEDNALTFSISASDALSEPDLFIEDNQNIGFSKPHVTISQQGREATLVLTPVDTLPTPNALFNLPVTLTLVDGERAAEFTTHLPAATINASVETPARLPLALALFFALIGGLILNLMPCVLPVLSLKILSLINHGGGTPRAVRHSFVVSACGIIFSFLVLAATTVLLKHLGLSLGWGVQFQQPIFLMLLIVLLTFFAANLWTLFEIPLPQFLGERLTNTYHPKLAGDFATGAFATLLATPCSAPFLGTAVGFALSAGAPEIFAVFTALGFGMALPYIGVALFPRSATLLPKPGAWMIKLRISLGFALSITALWLLWVLAAQITVSYAVLFGFLMAGIIVLLALKKRGYRRSLIGVGLVEFVLLGLILGYVGMSKPKELPEMDRQWLAYDENAVRADLSEGKTVFLDVTADWCLTCKANMKFTLSQSEITERLFHSDIIAMQADWTNPDPVISDLLHRYGRYGIPFNIVYGPAAPDGITLPELLTPELVLDALNKASGAKK